MSNTDKHITIPKKVEIKNDLDFSFLRKKGLEYIEQLSAKFWTDYNTHDPGITVLEMLCYAITDLSARIDLPIETILEPGEKEKTVENQFFKASQILTSKPVTEADYRKLFIDIDGVKNCWLQTFKKTVYANYEKDEISYEPCNPGGEEDSSFFLQGLYSLIIELDELSDVDFPKPEDKQAEITRLKKVISKQITKTFHANRNLCEDLIDIKFLTDPEKDFHPIKVCAEIEIDPEADEELVHAHVERTIEKYFSPELRFYSLKQMFDKGYTSDEIFEGPLLNNGFIDSKELKNASLRKEVRLSDIMKLIMKIKGVKVIKDISISNCTKTGNKQEDWIICIEKGKKPVVCNLSKFSYYKGVLPLNINEGKVKEYKKDLKAEEEKLYLQARIGMEIEIPRGVYSNLNETTTIQNDFPDTYGIGLVGLPAMATIQRKSQAKQLKTYLLFFDQVFACYFAHLEKVKDQLSVNNCFISETNEPEKTYFSQAVKDLKGFKELISDYPLNDNDLLSEKLFSAYKNSKDLDNKVERNNMLLNHLIARFAEKFSDYSFLMKVLYGNFANKAIIDSKAKFLKDYPITSSEREKAFNYQLENKIWDTDNVSGFQKRIARLAGIKNIERRNLSESFVEIYIEPDSEPDVVFRWRIRDKNSMIILSATDDYKTPNLAEKEMQFAVVKIIETTVSEIETAFKTSVKKDDEIGNFLIRVSAEGKYSFDIINKNKLKTSVDWIIARQFIYYDTENELKTAMLEIIRFMSNDFTEEGMFLVEHILLRPNFDLPPGKTKEQFMPICAEKGESCQPVDPYSYRVTIILPGWTYRFSDMNFRRFMEKLIRSELPAHILARICWVGYPADYYELILETNRYQIEMQRKKLEETYNKKLEETTDEELKLELQNEYQELLVKLNEKEVENEDKYKDQKADLIIFEEAYEKYLTNLSKNKQKNFKVEHGESPCEKLINSMVELNSIYPQGRLFDCGDETDELKGKVILDQTNLGTL